MWNVKIQSALLFVSRSWYEADIYLNSNLRSVVRSDVQMQLRMTQTEGGETD